jgi:hypothetical protein
MIPIISSLRQSLSLPTVTKRNNNIMIPRRQFATKSTTTFRRTSSSRPPTFNDPRSKHCNRYYHKRSYSSSTSATVSSFQYEKDKYLLPKRIILIRHGESLGNIDETAYASIPDWKIPLTRRYVLLYVCCMFYFMTFSRIFATPNCSHLHSVVLLLLLLLLLLRYVMWYYNIIVVNVRLYVLQVI